jgi:hypothetical protein
MFHQVTFPGSIYYNVFIVNDGVYHFIFFANKTNILTSLWVLSMLVVMLAHGVGCKHIAC